MLLRDPTGEWVTNMPENMNLDWVNGVKVSNFTFFEKNLSFDIFMNHVYL